MRSEAAMSDRRTSRAMLRQGFTLVEMLVATALIIFVMLILTTVFTAGLQALRNMRGVGSMQDSLRQAATIIRRDLTTPHFAEHTTATAGPALSQQRLDLYDWTPPREGFFRIWQGSTSGSEGTDGDLQSFRMNPYPDPPFKTGTLAPSPTPPKPLLSYLHFTVRNELGMGEGAGRDRYVANISLESFVNGLTEWPQPQKDAERQKYRAASRPEYLSSDSMLYSSWAEVAYFVQPVLEMSGTNIVHATVGSTGAPLYTLYRRRKFLIDSRPPNFFTPIPDKKPAPNDAASMIPDMSYYRDATTDPMNPVVYLNTPSDVTSPGRRFPVDPNNLNTFAQLPPMPIGGDDVLMENVISFEIRASWDVPRDLHSIGARKTCDRQDRSMEPPELQRVTASRWASTTRRIPISRLQPMAHCRTLIILSTICRPRLRSLAIRSSCQRQSSAPKANGRQPGIWMTPRRQESLTRGRIKANMEIGAVDTRTVVAQAPTESRSRCASASRLCSFGFACGIPRRSRPDR